MKKKKLKIKVKLAEADEVEAAADALIRRSSRGLGYGGLYLAVRDFDLTPACFDAEGRLVDEAADELYQLVGDNIQRDGRIFCDSMLNNLTRVELNIMRQAQGMPPV